MTILHIVAFKTGSPAGLSALTTAFLALQSECLNPTTGQPYIQEVRGGKQISTEGRDRGMQVCFVMEFENDDDLQYYLYKDPAHEQFKGKALGQWEAIDVVALDFSSGKY
ncbi:hypothetical protein IAT38_008322 [Cryptococcus sp. DSM 104549]